MKLLGGVVEGDADGDVDGVIEGDTDGNVDGDTLIEGLADGAALIEGLTDGATLTEGLTDGATLIYFLQKSQDSGHDTRTVFPFSFISQNLSFLIDFLLSHSQFLLFPSLEVNVNDVISLQHAPQVKGQ